MEIVREGVLFSHNHQTGLARREVEPVKKTLQFLLVTLLLATISCAVGGRGKAGVVFTTEAFKLFSGEYENTEYFKTHKPRSLATAPFEKSDPKAWSIDLDSERPTEIVRRGMYNHIASLPFQDLELHEGDLRLRNAGLDTPEKVNDMVAKDPRKLKSILGVDAIVTGKVTHFDRIYMGILSQVAVGCEVKMWDLKSGELLWRAKHVSRGTGGGISLNPLGLALSAAVSIWNLRGAAMLQETDNLFREISSTIEVPESPQALRVERPTIDLFVCLNAQRPLKAGEKVTFRMIGNPDCEAYFDLMGYKSGMEMKGVPAELKGALMEQVLGQVEAQYRSSGHELTPEVRDGIRKVLAERGVYEGAYMVEPGEQVYGLTAKGYLVNAARGQSAQLDVINTIDIDGLPPQAPSGLFAVPLDGKLHFMWDESPEPDLKAYEIWTSASQLSGYQLTGVVETNEFLLKGLNNFKALYTRVRAVDRAGNEGGWGATIKAVPLPEPGLYELPQPGPVLDGTITERVLLRAAKGPFFVHSGLQVKTGGTLYVEPGVEIRFSPESAIQVIGGEFLAYGEADNRIRLLPASPEAPPGAFEGLVLVDSRRALLQDVFIERANTGVRIRDCAPRLVGVEIKKCAQAGIVMERRARAEITCSFIHANQGMGGLVLTGEGVAPKIRSNVFQDNQPFHVQSFVPLEVDLSGNYWGGPEPDREAFLGDRLILEPFLSVAPQVCPH